MNTSQNVIFRNVRVIDGNEDESFSADVLVRDGEVVAGERGGGLPEADDRTIDGGGRTLMSGRCDAPMRRGHPKSERPGRFRPSAGAL